MSDPWPLDTHTYSKASKRLPFLNLRAVEHGNEPGLSFIIRPRTPTPTPPSPPLPFSPSLINCTVSVDVNHLSTNHTIFVSYFCTGGMVFSATLQCSVGAVGCACLRACVRACVCVYVCFCFYVSFVCYCTFCCCLGLFLLLFCFCVFSFWVIVRVFQLLLFCFCWFFPPPPPTPNFHPHSHSYFCVLPTERPTMSRRSRNGS